jgi:hypothetical protein
VRIVSTVEEWNKYQKSDVPTPKKKAPAKKASTKKAPAKKK